MAILLTFLTNLTLTSFICGFILELDINIRINKDMNIKKKMLERTVARQVFIFSYHNTSADLNTSLLFGSAINRENRDE